MTETAETTARTGAAGRTGGETEESQTEQGPSVTDQAKEKVQETAQGVQQKAQEVKGQAGDRVRQEVEKHSVQTGSQLLFTADAMRRTGKQLQQEGKDGPAKVTEAVAERAERLGNYMSAANTDQILRDVEDFARRQPWLVAIGGTTIGFLASRFMKASSSRRYEESGDLYYAQRYTSQHYTSPGVQGASQPSSGYGSPALPTPATTDLPTPPVSPTGTRQTGETSGASKPGSPSASAETGTGGSRTSGETRGD
jgi:ElaB/YqjD/DUF883 family membrane-anchored ribosome-binding protein